MRQTPQNRFLHNTGFTYWDIAAGSISAVLPEKIHGTILVRIISFTKPKVAFQKQYDIALNPKWVINAGLSIPTSDVNKVIVYADYFMQGGAGRYRVDYY